MSKALGTIDKININIDKPLNINDEIQNNNKVSLFVGINGSGKSFLNKIVYCISSIANIYISNNDLNITKKQAQFFFDNCFDEQNINGTISLTFTSEFEIKLTFVHGNITDLDVNHVKCTTGTNIVYMSSNMRLLTELEKYINIKNTLLPKGLITDNDILTLCKFYKLYDILYAETLYNKLKIGIELKSQSFSSFEGFKDITRVYYNDTSQKICYSLLDGTDGLVSLLSAGEQSILNMYITQLINT